MAMTRSKMRHEKLLKAGAEPVAIEDFFPEELKDDFKNIVFLVPPTQFGYLQTLTSALKKWKANKHPHSKFIFASSISVYRHSDQVIDEQSPTDPDASPNAKALLEAERLVLEEGGTVLRFAGLYSLEPGVGSFFLRGGNLQVRPDRIVSIVSYFDAASAIIKVLDAESPDTLPGQVFVIADGQDQSMESIYRSALKAGAYTPEGLAAEGMPTFTERTGDRGKRLDASKARAALGWAPSFKSFDDYCLHMGGAQKR